MLDHVTIKNFRCLREVSVPLKPLTVLIGENDTGKSTFLEAIYRAARAVGGPPQLEELDHWRGQRENVVELCMVGSRGTSSIEPIGYYEEDGRSLPGEYMRSDADRGAFDHSRGVSHLAVDPGRIRLRGKRSPTAEDVGHLLSEGANVPAVMDQMLRTHRRTFDDMERRCRELVTQFGDFSLVVDREGLIALELRDEQGFELPGYRLSAGVRALILYLTLAYRPDAPDIVLVEEPENGLHPRRLGEVMGLLRLLTEPKADGQRTQVILTTHSPFLLDHVRPDEDQVLIFERQPDGSRTATPADWDRARRFLKFFSPGEIWFNRGEASLVPAPEIDEEDDAFDALGRPVSPTPGGESGGDLAPAAAGARAAA